MAGYSGTPLPRKLGLWSGMRVLVLDEPPGFRAALGELPTGVEQATRLAGRRPFDVAVAFVTSEADLWRAFSRIAARMTPAGSLWFAWPKKSSGLSTDLCEHGLRARILPSGWVDNKVCAIDERWSGLRFVLRKELRPGGTRATAAGSRSRRITPPRRPR